MEAVKKAKERVISLRVSKLMEQLLEERAQEWNMSISDTVRAIVGFYFSPSQLEKAWRKKAEELIEKNKKEPILNKIENVFVDTYVNEEFSSSFVFDIAERYEAEKKAMRMAIAQLGKVAGGNYLEQAKAIEKEEQSEELLKVEP